LQVLHSGGSKVSLRNNIRPGYSNVAWSSLFLFVWNTIINSKRNFFFGYYHQQQASSMGWVGNPNSQIATAGI